MTPDRTAALNAFLAEHHRLTRRYFLRVGAVGAAAVSSRQFVAADSPAGKPKPDEAKAKEAKSAAEAKPSKPEKPEKAGAKQDPYFTPTAEFRDVSRGKPVPHSLDEAKRREVGLTRDTWKLEITSDPEHPARLGREFKKADDTAFDFDALMKLAEKHTVRIPKVMTCLNLGCPLGMGLWEGVPLRELVLLTEPREDLRRVFYYGYHNDDPEQMFRSSLPIGRVLEDPTGWPPVIACYKLNGEWLDQERGGPVRIVVPEAYGFKSIKWLSNLVLTNLWYANDTYGEKNNDVDSPLKSFAATLEVPRDVKAGEPIAVSGYAQVGISGVKKVQVSIESTAVERPTGDRYFTKAPWVDAELLAPPQRWDTLPGGKIPPNTAGFDAAGKPQSWPMPLAKVHWAAVLPGLPAGEYALRSRTIDDRGYAQPLPRPLRKGGHNAIETITLKVREA